MTDELPHPFSAFVEIHRYLYEIDPEEARVWKAALQAWPCIVAPPLEEEK